MLRRRRAGRMASLVALLVLAACGDDDETSVDEGPGVTTTVPGPVPVTCGDTRFDYSALSSAPTVDSLEDGPADALADPRGFELDLSGDWRVADESADRVVLLRELEEPETSGEGDVRTHDLVLIERVTGVSGIEDGTWTVMGTGRCALRLPLPDGLADADLVLVGIPGADARTIDLQVFERACASGMPADGRVEVVELDEGPAEVRLRVGVRTQEGDHACPSNPPTELSVALSEPLGDRRIVDGSTVPARVLR